MKGQLPQFSLVVSLPWQTGSYAQGYVRKAFWAALPPVALERLF